MSSLYKFSSPPLIIIGIVFLIISTCAGQMSNLYAEDNKGLNELKRIGIEEFQIQNRSNNLNVYPIDPGTGIKVAHVFYKELSSYHHYDLTAPDEMPFRIELVKMPATIAGLPAQADQIKKSETGMIEEKSKDIMEIPEANLIDLDSIVTRVISRYKDTNLDAVVAGVVTRYNDKDGSSFAVNKPASVAFIAYLIGLRDKKILWSGHFAETQVALLDNLLLVDRFIEAGGVWLSSDDLTQLVMQRGIKTFPGVKQNKIKLISK